MVLFANACSTSCHTVWVYRSRKGRTQMCFVIKGQIMQSKKQVLLAMLAAWLYEWSRLKYLDNYWIYWHEIWYKCFPHVKL